MVQAVMYTTLGELIREYRKQANLKLTGLAALTNISKGVISKLENGETRRPELKTILPIAKTLEIPTSKIIEYYVELDERPEILRELLMEAIQLSDAALVAKVALKFLQSSHEESFTLVQRLYDITSQIEATDMKLTVYDRIISYSREHGIQNYLAKSLLQKYLIERDDFTRLEVTYQTSKYILHYQEFLSLEERILMNYKIGVHAYNLRLYQECIELCKRVLDEDQTRSRIKADATFAICNSYYYLGDYDAMEFYLREYSQYSFSDVMDNTKLVRAVLDGKQGKVETAVKQLKECLLHSGDNVILHMVNQLFELCLQINDQAGLDQVLSLEDRIQQIKLVTPFKKVEFAHFYKLKGDYFLAQDEFDKAIDCYLRSALEYAKVSAHVQSYESINLILELCTNQMKEVNISILKKLQKVYNELREN